MLGSREKRHIIRAAVTVVATVCLFTSCASTPSDGESALAGNSETSSDSALLLDHSATSATDVPDSGAFADLEPGKDKPIVAATDPEPKSESSVTPAEDGASYYNSVGGETIRRVALTLYSDKNFATNLLDKNPELKGAKRLIADQKVYFDMNLARPEPTYLTKDLLDRYPGQLAERLTASVTEKGISKTTVRLNKGETLQELSKRLYGTHRYWTEIFLVNHDKIKNYDKVNSGIMLTVFERPNSGVATGPSEPAPISARIEPVAPSPARAEHPVSAPVGEAKPEPVAQAPIAVPTQSEPVKAIQEQPVITPTDPIPETPTPPEISSSNAVTRPIIYAALVLLILGAGFYYTRSPKKPKLDMLDITSVESSARPRLSPKDSQNKIG